MSQHRVRFDQMREGNPTLDETQLANQKAVQNEAAYETPGHSRALRFVWPDGKRTFLLYSYLVKAECSTDGAGLTIYFSGENVNLKGRNLHLLFEEISQQLVREISILEERYLELEETKGWIVSDIKIENT